jgi:putative membrane protein
MTGSSPRKPAAFRLDDEPATPRPAKEKVRDKADKARTAERKPQAFRDVVVVTPSPVDVFDAEAEELPPIEDVPVRGRRFSFAGLFLGAFGALVSLALWMWVDSVITTLFERADWLGWTALAAAVLALFGLLGVVARELLALRRLSSVHTLRSDAADALAANDAKAARAAVARLEAIARDLPSTARGRAALGELEGEVIDGRDLVRLAESEILKPLDRAARDMILSSAKRVSVVTAVSPRALVDLGYVVYECARLVRRLSTHYGGRPGTLGFIRLTRDVVAHLAVTGTVAMGDSIVQQLIGHGLAARVSARLGEGVVNGLMTARVGIAAMDVVRPFPFNAEKRPRIGDFLADLGGLGGERTPLPDAAKDE